MVELISLVFPAVMIAALATDLKRFEIPNLLPVILIAAYPLAAFAAGQGMSQFLAHAAVAFGILAVCMALYFFSVFGGGDAKLIAAAALWTGPDKTAEFVLLTAVFGGITALVLLLFWHRPLPTFVANVPGLQRLHAARHQVPYAVGIAAGGLTAYPQLPLLTS